MADALKHRVGAVTVDALAERFTVVHDGFDATGFRAAVVPHLPRLELKDRVNLIADALATTLPADYPDALALVVRAAEQPIDEWAAWPLCSFVERHGVEHPSESLTAMPTLTRRWSCEFAIRPFLEHHLELSREHLRRWAVDPDEAVRRLASEGTRPLLPWGPRVRALTDDPQIGIELLGRLRHDDSETVRRSVANHLNDVAKSQPDLVVGLLRTWTDEPEQLDQGMVRHALRTLVKQGHPGALRLLGFTTDPSIDVIEFACRPPSIRLGSRLELVAELKSTAATDQVLVIDVVIHHVNASGATSPKVFKWTTVDLAPGESSRLTKRRLIEHASTRTYHSGVHRVDLQVAGHTVAHTTFELETT